MKLVHLFQTRISPVKRVLRIITQTTENFIYIDAISFDSITMGKEDLTHTATSTVLAEIVLRRYAFVRDIQCPATLIYLTLTSTV